jgi:hypothetical protein
MCKPEDDVLNNIDELLAEIEITSKEMDANLKKRIWRKGKLVELLLTAARETSPGQRPGGTMRAHFQHLDYAGHDHRWAQSAMDRWIDTDGINRYYQSIFLVSFSMMLSTIDHKSLL